MSKFYFRYGAMNCGKSTILMQVAHNYDSCNKKVVIIKSNIDTKGGEYLESRIGLKRKVDFIVKPKERLNKYFDLWKKADCILVDEAQFLTTNQVEDLWSFCKKFDIPVICYGLKTNFKGYFFEGSKRLAELADELEELITICKCGKRAKFNARFINDKFVLDGDIVSIDGKQKNVKYVPVCGKCFLNLLNSIKDK